MVEKGLTQDHRSSLDSAIAIVKRLRAPDGCPWDREQTFDSIRKHTLEETYEVFDAIERRAWPDLQDELGDLLLQVLLYSQIADEAGLFSIADVAAGLSAKLTRRHPHVFGEATARSVEEVKQTWDAVKQSERAQDSKSATLYLDTVARHVPAMSEAVKLGAHAARVGFDWPNAHALMEKVKEEAGELDAEIGRMPVSVAAQFDELGDLLFTVVQLARGLELEPEFALRAANAKFRRRFNAMEVASGGVDRLQQASAQELDDLWRAAKLTSKQAVSPVAAEKSAVDESHRDSSSRSPE